MKFFSENKIEKLKPLFWSIAVVMITFPALAQSAGVGQTTGGGTATNPLKSRSFADLVEGIADIVFKIGVPIAAIFLIYSGLLFVTARGNEEQLKKAKTTFWWAVLGTAVLLGAKVIASAIKTTVQSF